MDLLCDLASDVGDPFTNDDMFKGRRMCDLTTKLFHEVVEYDLNQRGPLPKATEVAPKMLSMRGENHANINFIVNLSLNKLKDLWPGYEYPPPTPQGVVWQSVQLLPKIIGARQESLTNK